MPSLTKASSISAGNSDEHEHISAVKRKIDDEFERFSKFATDVLGISDKQKAQNINQRKYVKYLPRNGTMEEKR